MWTSRPPGQPVRRGPRRTLDACVLAVVLEFLPELAASRAGAVLDPHPGWIAVLVLAARYGSAGLLSGLIAAAVAIGLGTAVAGAGHMASWSHLDSAPNLVA